MDEEWNIAYALPKYCTPAQNWECKSHSKRDTSLFLCGNWDWMRCCQQYVETKFSTAPQINSTITLKSAMHTKPSHKVPEMVQICFGICGRSMLMTIWDQPFPLVGASWTMWQMVLCADYTKFIHPKLQRMMTPLHWGNNWRVMGLGTFWRNYALLTFCSHGCSLNTLDMPFS